VRTVIVLGSTGSIGVQALDVIAANRDHRSMGHGALEENDHFGRAGPDIDQASAQLPLVRGDGRLGRRHAFKDRIRNLQARLVRAGHQTLRCAGGAGTQVKIHLQPVADHANGIVDARLLIEDELLWKQMYQLTLGRQ